MTMIIKQFIYKKNIYELLDKLFYDLIIVVLLEYTQKVTQIHFNFILTGIAIFHHMLDISSFRKSYQLRGIKKKIQKMSSCTRMLRYVCPAMYKTI